MSGAVASPIDIVFDFSYDANHFFSDAGGNPIPERRAALDYAARAFEHRFSDDLAAIVPNGNNTWSTTFVGPADGVTKSVSNPVIPEHTLIVYVGGRSLGALAQGGPGGWSYEGSAGWGNLVQYRRQQGAETKLPTDLPTDFGPWGGSITFSSSAAWSFDTSGPVGGAYDFASTAMHELGHVLGIGTTASWTGRVSGGFFTGPLAKAANNGVNVPLADPYHFAYGLTSVAAGVTQEVAMDPDITSGVRKLFTQLDYAALMDVGWSAVPGDANHDDRVDLTDLAILTRHYGGLGDWSQGDFTDDGLVNVYDLTVLRQQFGTPLLSQPGFGGATQPPPTPAPQSPAPEPSTALALLALTAAMLRRRQGSVPVAPR